MDTASNSIKVYSLKSKTNLGVVFREENVHPWSIVLYPEKGYTNIVTCSINYVLFVWCHMCLSLLNSIYVVVCKYRSI